MNYSCDTSKQFLYYTPPAFLFLPHNYCNFQEILSSDLVYQFILNIPPECPKLCLALSCAKQARTIKLHKRIAPPTVHNVKRRMLNCCVVSPEKKNFHLLFIHIENSHAKG
ncbi:hypothetical protein NC651_039795 [Populus alba x Populus x berolinensis]|nr:hypothetical protein NC651_039795 [Populus alba x Populus x berolinensis]